MIGRSNCFGFSTVISKPLYRFTFVVASNTRLNKVSGVLYSKVGIKRRFNSKLIVGAFSTKNVLNDLSWGGTSTGDSFYFCPAFQASYSPSAVAEEIRKTKSVMLGKKKDRDGSASIKSRPSQLMTRNEVCCAQIIRGVMF